MKRTEDKVAMCEKLAYGVFLVYSLAIIIYTVIHTNLK